jgi:hypothetical protein
VAECLYKSVEDSMTIVVEELAIGIALKLVKQVRREMVSEQGQIVLLLPVLRVQTVGIAKQ